MTPVSICAIIKNEEKRIERFLSSIENNFKGYPHEIILIDTGSTDKTLELAEHFPVSIFHFQWVNDFSAARNFSLSKASNSFVCVLDADEFVDEIDTSFIDSFITQFPNGVGMLKRKNYIDNESEDSAQWDDVPRFFNKENFHYLGSIHEQVVKRNDNSLDFERITIPLKVSHTGYLGTPEEKAQKAQRNITLLESMPGKDNDPYILYQLGQSYYFIKDYDSAIDSFSKALEFDLDTKLDYVRQMVVSDGYALLETGRIDEALGFSGVYDEFADYPEFVLMMGLIFLKAGMLEEAVDQFLKATSFKEASTVGVNTFIPLYNLGCISEVLGNIDDAKSLYRQCGNYEPAINRLKAL